MQWYRLALSRFVDFSGRSRRKEYWFFVLYNFLICMGLTIVDWILGTHYRSGFSLFANLYGLAVLLPSLAVAMRRLHDTNRSGWWLLIGIIPLIGALVLLVFNLEEGTPGPNRYGPNPKGDSQWGDAALS